MRFGGTAPSGGRASVPRGRAAAVAVVALASLTVAMAPACTPDREVGALRPGGTTGAKTFTAIAQDALVPRCATSACHGGSVPPAAPALDANLAWSAMVGVPSQQASGTNLVEPFAPERSYLVMKLRGTAADAGGLATLMPIGDAALDEDEIAAIEAWIALGAPND
jgi:hypothetical protein